jgi:hypothetical protein
MTSYMIRRERIRNKQKKTSSRQKETA